MKMDEQTELVLRTEAASRLNASLADQIIRWKRTRLVLLLILLALAIACCFFPSWTLFTPPLFLGAMCFLFLYLEARDQLREVKARRWKSQTPFISRLDEARRQKQPEVPPPTTK
jgi:hypothetical protein